MVDLDWDPEIDTPATIAIIGGGSTGVEAALYARFLGYSVMLFEAGKIGHRLAAWGDHRLSERWSDATSPLGLAALEAQGSDIGRFTPTDNSAISCREYVESYLLPVARTDLLYDSMHINSKVVSISRCGCRPDVLSDDQERAECEFRLLIESQQRGEYSQLADIILDCSGCETRRVGMASGGGLAIGQRQCGALSFAGKVDISQKYRATFADKHILVFGTSPTAIANVLDLAELIKRTESTRVTWVIPKRPGTSKIEALLDAALPPSLLGQCQALVNDLDSGVVAIAAWGVEALSSSEDGTIAKVRLQVTTEETLDIEVNLLIDCSPPLADYAFLAGSMESPERSPQFHQAGSIATREPHYYVLGQKVLKDHSPSPVTARLDQIRAAFALVGGREQLNLYQTVKPQSI